MSEGQQRQHVAKHVFICQQRSNQLEQRTWSKKRLVQENRKALNAGPLLFRRKPL